MMTHLAHYQTASGTVGALEITCPIGFTEQAYRETLSHLRDKYGQTVITGVTPLAPATPDAPSLDVPALLAQLGKMATRLDRTFVMTDPNIVRSHVRTVATELRNLSGGAR